MKQKFAALALALGLTLSLAACGGGAPAGGESPSPQNSAAPQAAGAYVFTTGDGVTVSVDEDMAQVLTDLGEAQSYFEAESCAFEGLDKTYTYPGFVITTRPDGRMIMSTPSASPTTACPRWKGYTSAAARPT